MVGWGSTWGPVREAVNRLRAGGMRAGQVHLRHLHPLPPGLDEIFRRYGHVLVVEMNDEGLYGFGQMAMMLRARYALPSIRSITKTDGLTFRISEIVSGVTRNLGRNGSHGAHA
jgi:2-oxoglutarate ferredoxin oxidoreductase subunit alpha